MSPQFVYALVYTYHDLYFTDAHTLLLGVFTTPEKAMAKAEEHHRHPGELAWNDESHEVLWAAVDRGDTMVQYEVQMKELL